MSVSPLFCDHCGAANRAQAAFCFACGQPLHSAPVDSADGSLPVGSELHQRYRILGQFGKGGFGEVYRAADLQLGERLVAIKEMSQAGLNTREMQEASEAFKNEALLLAKLRHPNLPGIHEYFSEAGHWYLVMDFIEGESLADYLQQAPTGRLSPREVLSIAIQLCTVLDYLHTRQPPVIFRDLKPSNVMRAPDGQLYLIDFGIARHFKPGQAKDTTAFGSAGYAAPEQYGRAQTTARADIYSLGATLHELLTGRDPSEHPFEFEPPQNLVPVHSAFGRLIMRMLAMSASQRPASAAEVLQELQRNAALWSRESSRIRATAPASPQPQPEPEPEPPKPKPQPKQLASMFTYNDHRYAVQALAWSPNGKYIASTGREQTVHVWNASTGERLGLYQGHNAPVRALTWSPDGSCIASGSEDRTIRVWEALTQRILFSYREHEHYINAVAWSPDGSRIVSAGIDKTAQIWDAQRGWRLYTYLGHRDIIYAAAWSPDGKYIATGGEDQTAQIWEASSGNRLRMYREHQGTVRALAWSPDGQYIASGGEEWMTYVWNVHTGRIIMTHAHEGSVLSLAWSPDGKYIAAGGTMREVEVWEVATGDTLFVYSGHLKSVYTLAWSPDGKAIASAGEGASVHIWQAP